MKRKVTSAWMDGFIEGITLYAHWEDGTQYVGTTGKTLNQAIDDAYTEVVVVSREEPIGPRRVCLCGSTRFYEAFQRANYEETMAGRIVLSVGFYPHSHDKAHGEGVGHDSAEKVKLDELHMRKIDLADEILVLNVSTHVCGKCGKPAGLIGRSPSLDDPYLTACCNVEKFDYRPYIGDSSTGKPVRWLNDPGED
jgi:hypothetical protein